MDRNSAALYKTLVVGVIVLFIGRGIQPSYADNPTPISEEIYENTNCFVIGISSFTVKAVSGIFKKSIGFGIWDIRKEEKIPSYGSIYTKGDQGEWFYKGEFFGDLRVISRFVSSAIVSYEGVKNFHGVCFGGLMYFYPYFSRFIGFAKEVKITTETPKDYIR